jgi:hypothetical protein
LGSAEEFAVNHSLTVLERLAALPPPTEDRFIDEHGGLVLIGQSDRDFMREALRREFLELFPEVEEIGQKFLAAGAPVEWLRDVVVKEWDEYGAYVLAEELTARASHLKQQ